jgi:uncharacterized protein (TIGR00661 family)
MNILYGLSGEGYGHSSRALLIIPFLQKLGHKVKVLTYSKAEDVLKDGFDVFEIHGMHLIFENHRIKKRKTIWSNIKNFPKNYLERKKIQKLVNDFNPDLCITDYEPLTYIISKLYHLPLISIGNHQIIDYAKINIPVRYYRDYMFVKGINKSFTPNADFFIITTFLKMKNKKNVYFVPPIVRDEVKKVKCSDNGKVLVYLNHADYVLDILKEIPEKEFLIYGFNVKRKEANLEFKTKDTFLKDLANCNAIISTAGFTLISEAIYLKKPLLAIPQKGQFEQVFNAITLKKAGFGEYHDKSDLNEKRIIDFLKNLGKYKKNLKNYQVDYNNIFSVLEKVLKKV